MNGIKTDSITINGQVVIASGGTMYINGIPITSSTSLTGVLVKTPNALSALAIDVTRSLNTKTISADQTFTFNGTPTASDTFIPLRVTNVDSVPHILTIPTGFSFNQQTNVSQVTIPASGKLLLTWEYDGTGYNLYGDPAPSGGSLAYDMVSPLVNTPRTITGTTVLTSSDFGSVVYLNPTTANMTLTLPTITGNAYKSICFKVLPTATKLITFTGNASNTIDGDLSTVMWKKESVDLVVSPIEWNKFHFNKQLMKCIMYKDSTTSVPATTVTDLPCNQVKLDNTSLMGDMASNRIDVLRGGDYIFAGQITSDPSTSAPTAQIRLNKNGSAILAFATDFPAPTAAKQWNVALTLAAGDYIQLATYQTSSSTLTYYGASNDLGTSMGLTEQ